MCSDALSSASSHIYLGVINQKMLVLPLVYLLSISSRVNCRKCGGITALPAPFLLSTELWLQPGGWGKSTHRRE